MSRMMLLSAALLFGILRAQTPPPVPSTYQDLYSALDSQIRSFAATITPGSFPVLYSAQLDSAVSANGSALLGPNYYTGVLLQLDELKALGIKAATLHIDFPVLYAPFYQNPADYQNYLNFYKQLASDIRARGLKLIVESTLVFPLDGIGTWDLTGYYGTLTESQYMAGRAQMITTVAQQIHPDYLSVITEPDTEATESGFADIGTVTGSTAMLNAMLTSLQQAGVTGVAIGAGCGSWLTNYQDFVRGFAALPIQYVDTHIYPVTGNFLANAATMADLAAQYGKPVAISEAWAYKQRDTEYGTLSTGTLAARDAFSFWAPIDSEFLRMLANFAQSKQALFIAPFWSMYFSSYVDYNATIGLTDLQISDMARTATGNAATAGLYSYTGQAYAARIISPPDTTAPSVPSNVTVQASTSQIGLTWATSTDNTGVAGYLVYRDGILVATTGLPLYLDSNLPSNQSYTYSLVAYDASGNYSAKVAVTAATLRPPDNTPPSVPQNVRAAGVSATQINLTWTASTDNVGVSGYKVYRGRTPSSMTVLAGPATASFADTMVAPGTVYYYAVAAYDAAGNFSANSITVAGTSLADTTPPSVPQGVTARAVSATQVNLAWGASTDNFMVAGYKIYRGTSPTGLLLIGGATTTTFSDVNAVAGKTYYYGIAATDVAGNASALSAIVTAATLPDTVAPSAPSNLTVTAVASTQVSLAWSPSTDNCHVASYRVYSGISAASLKLMGGVTQAAYTRTNLVTGVTYYFAVAAVDGAGNVSPLSAVLAVTAGSMVADTTAPTAPTGLKAQSVSAWQVGLGWDPSTDDVQLKGYYVYRGTSPAALSVIAASTTPSYTDGRISSGTGTALYYAVAAFDRAGNLSRLSDVATVQTP